MRVYIIVVLSLVYNIAVAMGKNKEEFKDVVKVSVSSDITRTTLNFVLFKNSMVLRCGIMEIGGWNIKKYVGSKYLKDEDDVDIKVSDSALCNYVRKSILRYYYYRKSQMFKYFRRVDSTISHDPSPPCVDVRIYNVDGRISMLDTYNLPFNVNAKTPQQVDDTMIVYTDEYARFLNALLYLYDKYSRENEATTGNNEY